MSQTNQEDETSGIRINKYLVSCGYESRRKADKLVTDGLVEINGQRAEAGTRVKVGDFVKVNGKQAKPKAEVTLLLNKPRGVVCSRELQGAAGTVYDLLPSKYRHVNYVGRLDADSEGLLLLTSKGDFSDRITQPKSHTEKEYWVTLNQPYENDVLLQLLKGLRLPEGQAKVKYVARLSPRRACVVLEQGLKRQIRQMFACMGLRVRKLVRVRIGSLWGGDLLPGHFTVMTPEQMQLALTNPKRRRGLIGATQAFPASGKLTAEQWDEKLDMQAARAALVDEANYKFNPDDFETEDEAVGSDLEAGEEAEDEFRKLRSTPQKKSRPSYTRSLKEKPDRNKHRPFVKRGNESKDNRSRHFNKRWRNEEPPGRSFRKRNNRSHDDDSSARPWSPAHKDRIGSARKFEAKKQTYGGDKRRIGSSRPAQRPHNFNRRKHSS